MVGDILVFLAGSNEIEKACNKLKAALVQLPNSPEENPNYDVNVLVLPLYANL